jgi:hypothetical protein
LLRNVVPNRSAQNAGSAGLGLYLWNSDDDSYRKIVTSPAYLSFLFRKDSTNNQNITIKVPFALLNLTLQAALVDEETPYFPCYPSDNIYSFGRAFLQAAFVSKDFGTGDGYGTWFLAQAPGARLVDVSDQANIPVSSSSIQASLLCIRVIYYLFPSYVLVRHCSKYVKTSNRAFYIVS